jgi:hypothetical protein
MRPGLYPSDDGLYVGYFNGVQSASSWWRVPGTSNMTPREREQIWVLQDRKDHEAS